VGFVRGLAWIGVALLSLPGAGVAQQIRPGDERPELEPFTPREELPPPLRLPPLAPPPRLGRTSSGQLIQVRELRVVGSTIFTQQELAAVTRPYENRELLPSDLQEVRDQLTRLYIDRGYVTSGAVIPDQDVSDGVVEIQIVEGELEQIDVETSDRLSPAYVEDRIRLGADAPVNVRRVEERLQLLQEDPRIARIDAELAPGRSLGRSRLNIGVQEARPWSVALEGSNERSPTVGAYGTRALLEHRNLTGHGDELSLLREQSKGFRDTELRYGVPLSARDTWLELRVRRSYSEVIEDPFDDLEIESDSTTYGLTVSHPVLRAPGRDLRLGLTAEHRRSDTDYIFGSYPFTPGSDDGHIKVSVLRFFQQWTSRAAERVVAARSTFNFGIDALRATENSSGPDSRYFAWLGQLQLAQRLPGRFEGLQLLLRSDVQLANDPLLSLEQFALGGLRTVRGYRENTLVRDNAWVSSLELRVPILIDSTGRQLLELRPFVDVGQAWDERRNSGPSTLASAGAGLVIRPVRGLQLEAYWGGRLRQVDVRGGDVAPGGETLDDDIQDHGWHFLARAEF
jgi:hemolysin activation/secretion protein